MKKSKLAKHFWGNGNIKWYLFFLKKDKIQKADAAVLSISLTQKACPALLSGAGGIVVLKWMQICTRSTLYGSPHDFQSFSSLACRADSFQSLFLQIFFSTGISCGNYGDRRRRKKEKCQPEIGLTSGLWMVSGCSWTLGVFLEGELQQGAAWALGSPSPSNGGQRVDIVPTYSRSQVNPILA